ncbi:MAG: caspase family protein [Bacteroidota bacterium]
MKANLLFIIAILSCFVTLKGQSLYDINYYKWVFLDIASLQKADKTKESLQNSFKKCNVPLTENRKDLLNKGVNDFDILTCKVTIAESTDGGSAYNYINLEFLDYKKEQVYLLTEKNLGRLWVAYGSLIGRVEKILEKFHYAYNDSLSKKILAQRDFQNQALMAGRTAMTPAGNIDFNNPLKEPKKIILSDVDINIPENSVLNPYRFVLIIGNEDYSSFQNNLNSEVNVDFAKHDAETFKTYAIKLLGIPEENVIFLANARSVEMNRAIQRLALLSKTSQGKGELFFYYAGHGFPDLVTQEPYLIPVDISGSDLSFAITLKELYSKLTEYPSRRVTVFLDACFSGGARNVGLLATRGMKVIPKDDPLKGNLVVFSACSGDQASLFYKDKQHGMFTYYLLKKFQETKGDLTYKELSDYLNEQVAIKSLLINAREQNPQTIVSPDMQNLWEHWKFNP